MAGIPATAAVGTAIALSSVGGPGTAPVIDSTIVPGCIVTGTSLTATTSVTCRVIGYDSTQYGTARCTFYACVGLLTFGWTNKGE